MSDPENDLPELDLEAVDGATESKPSPQSGAPETGAAPAGLAVAETPVPQGTEQEQGVAGQWVWQYGAPPPPPSFGAAFFSGTALPELYRFFACGLLVVLGCFLPWGPVLHQVANPALSDDPSAPALIEQVRNVPDVIGVQTSLGALSLVIGLWLLFSSCYGIYTRRQKILPVFLMLEPAIVSWLAMIDAYGQVGTDGGVLALLDAAGSGVLLTLIGSTLVSLQFLFVVGKVYAKKDEKGAARRSSAKGGRSKAGKGKGGKTKGSGASRAKGKGKGGDPAKGQPAAESASSVTPTSPAST